MTLWPIPRPISSIKNAGMWMTLCGRPSPRPTPPRWQRRTGARYQKGVYTLPFLNRELTVHPAQRLVQVHGQSGEEPEFQLCLTMLLFLLKVDAAQLPSRQVSPKEYKGGVVFFQGPHALPTARLEERFGSNRELFLSAGHSLGGEEVGRGDVAVVLTAYPNLRLEVILWLGDEEFPPQVILTAPSGTGTLLGLRCDLGLIERGHAGVLAGGRTVVNRLTTRERPSVWQARRGSLRRKLASRVWHTPLR